jgi:hypothetical protein
MARTMVNIYMDVKEICESIGFTEKKPVPKEEFIKQFVMNIGYGRKKAIKWTDLMIEYGLMLEEDEHLIFIE